MQPRQRLPRPQGGGPPGRGRAHTHQKGHRLRATPKPHEHWHVDVSYLNIAGTFYFLCSILDGYSRFIVHWEIREKMEEADVQTIIQRAREAYPGVNPRIISDNGPQFIAKDFKEFIRIAGMTHVKTSPYYPQSNGKIERWHKTLKGECIRVQVPLSLDDARRLVTDYVTHYNTVRLHMPSATSPPRTSWKAMTRTSLPNAIANWLRHANAGGPYARPVTSAVQRPPHRHGRLWTSPPSAPPCRWRPYCSCSASRSALRTVPSSVAPVRCTARRLAPVVVSRPT